MVSICRTFPRLGQPSSNSPKRKKSRSGWGARVLPFPREPQGRASPSRRAASERFSQLRLAGTDSPYPTEVQRFNARPLRLGLFRLWLAIVGWLLANLTCLVIDGDPVDRYNVIWDSPSQSSYGSMPLGNGDIGLNLWAQEDGDLFFYLSKTDAWDEQARLLKLGRTRVHLTPNPFKKGLPFRQ